jgi:hypothetical protein
MPPSILKNKFTYLSAILILLVAILFFTGNKYFNFKTKPGSPSLESYIGKYLSYLSGKAAYAWPVGETVKMRDKSAPVILEAIPNANKNLLKLKGTFELFSNEISPNYISYRVIVNYKQVFYKEGFCVNENIFPVDESITFEHPKEGKANITIAVIGIGGNGKWLNNGEMVISKDFTIEVE